MAVDQELVLRGSRGFVSRNAYAEFLRHLFGRLDAGRTKRLNEELTVLKSLRAVRLDATKRVGVRVSAASTVRVNHNTYSVNSRLIGEEIDVRLHSENLEVFYGGEQAEQMPRLRGENGYLIQYRHIIDWLVRNPGAFEHCRFRDALFLTRRFRMAYAQLRENAVSERATTKTYLLVLQKAAQRGEAAVDRALERLLTCAMPGSPESIAEELAGQEPSEHTMRRDRVTIPVDLSVYDRLLALPTEQEGLSL